MEELIENIKQRLKEYNMLPYEKISPKTQDRLLEVQRVINEKEEKRQKAIAMIEEAKITKSDIVGSEAISFSRKTLYNDEVLNLYLENVIKNEIEYKDLKEDLKDMKEKNKKLKEEYDLLLENIIDQYDIECELKKIKEQHATLQKRQFEFLDLINEKEDMIKELQLINRNYELELEYKKVISIKDRL
ncbi:MAG: hypothetical protein ACRC1P_03525 [Cellulosilyticaceae bacterium]